MDPITIPRTIDRDEIEAAARALHTKGYNCAQAVACAFAPLMGADEDLCFRMAEGLGGGIATHTETCGALLGGAAVLGAPLTHDFAVVSLSDLLTPWEKITARLTAAAQADFVLCLYNPASHSRPDYLQRACDILLSAGKDPATVCGTVRNIGRAGEEAALLTLGELRDTQVDMFTTVFVGNSQTKVIGGKMVTPRGYLQRGE